MSWILECIAHSLFPLFIRAWNTFHTNMGSLPPLDSDLLLVLYLCVWYQYVHQCVPANGWENAYVLVLHQPVDRQNFIGPRHMHVSLASDIRFKTKLLRNDRNLVWILCCQYLVGVGACTRRAQANRSTSVMHQVCAVSLWFFLAWKIVSWPVRYVRSRRRSRSQSRPRSRSRPRKV